MKKFYIALLSGFLMLSCGSKEEKVEGDLSQEDIEILEENSQINSEEINYEGSFKGKIQGKEIELKLNGESFEVTQNGRRAHGSWSKVDDGTIIELEPKSGSLNVKHYGWSDNDTWVALTDSLTYIEPEQLLKRIPD
ncbi:hypothetical protein [Moheibacter sp.]|uniref:hypothetical protein n=1 Tax=Moheibacter sp. TaxID=1965316 RepID=UPI003C72EE51